MTKRAQLQLTHPCYLIRLQSWVVWNVSQSIHPLEIAKSVLWCFLREGKDSQWCMLILPCILYFLSSLKYHVLSLFSLLSLSTHYLDFLHMFFLDFYVVLPTILVVVVPTFMAIVPFIPKIKPMWFSFFTLVFINHFVYCRHLANTHNFQFWPCIGGFISTTF